MGGVVDTFVALTKKSAVLVGLAAAPLSKPLLKRGAADAEAAVVSAFELEEAFEAVALREVEAAMGKRRAAQRLADNFLLAAHRPTEAEVRLSLKVTAAKLVADEVLVKPPKLTRAMFKKEATNEAISAILLAFPKHAGILALAHAEIGPELEAFSKAYQKTAGETVQKLGQRLAAQRLLGGFLLAAPSPTEAECRLSLQATLTVLNRP